MINSVFKQIQVEEAPGLDGLNGMFIKKCWSIIKEDFYALCEDFYNGTIELEPINSSFITMIPKINNPEGVNDYGPISLLNYNIKLVTKLLAQRLQVVILRLLYVNQYGFIRSRTIPRLPSMEF